MGITFLSSWVREHQTDLRSPQKEGVTLAGEMRADREGKQGTETLTDMEGVSVTNGGGDRERVKEGQPKRRFMCTPDTRAVTQGVPRKGGGCRTGRAEAGRDG